MKYGMKRGVVAICFAFLTLIFFASIRENSDISMMSVFGATEYPAAKGSCVIERTSLRILYGAHENERLPMASTTKVMTALVVLEHCPLTDMVTIAREAEGVEGSSLYIRADEKYSVQDLLYGLMLQSGNDCAVALALHTAKSIVAFAALMNEKANELGLRDTHFMNPHGLDHKEHYTTAYELAKITACAMSNGEFRKIVGSTTAKFEERKIVNKNKLLTQLLGATGVKTGYTKISGRCLVSACERDGMETIAVVLGCPDMWAESIKRIEQAFSKYRLVELLSPYEYVGESKGHYLFVKSGVGYPLTQEEQEHISTRLEVSEGENGEVIGKIKIYCHNDLLFSEKLYTIASVEHRRYFDYLNRVIQNFVL